MGEYFSYVNHTKKLHFSIGLIAHGVKFSGIGYGIGSRAFKLLLVLPEEQTPHANRQPLIGSWIGDDIAIIGDHGKMADSYYE